MAAVPLSELPRFPVTAGTAILAVGTTLAWMSGWDITAFTMDVRAVWAEPWRILTSALPHIGVFHLAFNVYWLWRFGARLEARHGHAATLLGFAILAATSALAEYAVLDGGVGLSGVGYGLLGILMTARHHDPALADAVDSRTIGLFAIWFLLCIVTTVTDVMPVANVAHGVGWIVGLALGAAVAGPKPRRWTGACLAVLLSAATVAAASVGRPALNQSTDAGQTSAWLGYHALVDEDPQAAVAHYERALSLNERASWQYNYGLALFETGDVEAAERALRRAADLDPADRYAEAVQALVTGSLTVDSAVTVAGGGER